MVCSTYHVYVPSPPWIPLEFVLPSSIGHSELWAPGRGFSLLLDCEIWEGRTVSILHIPQRKHAVLKSHRTLV